MNVKQWEVVIQTMTDEFNRATKESGKNLVLIEWRKSLAKEPQLLKPFQIDQIVREVRKRAKSTPPALHQQPFRDAIGPATALEIV